MSTRIRSRLLATVAALALACFALLATVHIDAQRRGAAPPPITPSTKPIPKTPWDGKPNLTGVWGPATYGPGPNQDSRTPTNAERNASLDQLQKLYQPWAWERSKQLKYIDDPRFHCGPYGFPKYINIPDYFLLQIVQAPKETLVLVEYIYSGFRVISTDGTPHPAKVESTYFGDSVGRWEGDTLVVDVTGFNGKIWLPGTNGGDGGRITSDALHEVERWRLLDADTLEYQATVEDSKVLTGSWTTPKFLLKRAPEDVYPNEALCLDPEDLEHMKAIEGKK